MIAALSFYLFAAILIASAVMVSAADAMTMNANR